MGTLTEDANECPQFTLPERLKMALRKLEDAAQYYEAISKMPGARSLEILKSVLLSGTQNAMEDISKIVSSAETGLFTILIVVPTECTNEIPKAIDYQRKYKGINQAISAIRKEQEILLQIQQWVQGGKLNQAEGDMEADKVPKAPMPYDLL